jgi:hypothetical protein
LNRLSWRDYVRHANPLAAALMARMQIAPRDRRRVKLESLSYLAGLSLDARRKRMIGAFISTYLRLTPIEEQQLRRDLDTLYPNQREAFMELVSEWEVKGRMEGRTEGRTEEALALVSRLLTRKLGPLPTDVEERLSTLAVEQLEELAETLLDFAALGDVTAWLDAHL